MNNIPTMMLTTGFKTDQNGALTEIVTPNVVATLNAPRKVTFEGQILNWIPSTTAALQELSCPNMESLTLNSSFNLRSYTNLTSFSCESLLLLTDTYGNSYGSFSGTQITAFSFPNLKDIVLGSTTSMTRGVPITSVNLPSLETFQATGNYSCIFYGISITTLNLPKFSAMTGNGVGNSNICDSVTSLTDITLGSEGHPVTMLGSNAFKNCTQATLTITVYTQGGAALAGEPWGATNATIEYEEA